MIDKYEAVFRPIVVVTMTENASVATIEFDWSDSFSEVIDAKTQRELGANDVAAPFTHVMDRWTKQFPTTWQTKGILPEGEVLTEIHNGRTIQAIKALRAQTGMGLALAKDLVVDHWLPKYKKGYRA